MNTDRLYRFGMLFTLCLAVISIPGAAQTVYDNGPTNGNTGTWNLSTGSTSIVSDTFTVSHDNTIITGANFAMWLFPGDTLVSAELSITSEENGGTTYFDQFVNFTQNNCSLNNFTYDVCQESTSFSGPTLNSGTYWLNLENADAMGNGLPQVYWDENSGPSLASQNMVGSIPSESFTLLGTSSTTGTVPEPSSIMLLGSGILGLAGAIRRRLL